MGKTAIVLGATGLTGGILLKRLIADDRYTTLKLFSRSAVHQKSEKIKEFLIDVLELSKHQDQFLGDEVFCCIGTTTAKTKDKSQYKAIDYGIPVAAAKLATQNDISTFIVMSSMGADANSVVFYNQTKGEMERDVLQQNIKNTYILRPSLIGGNRDEKRLGESIGKKMMTLLNPLMLGSLKKYRMIHPEKIGICMQVLANSTSKKAIIESDEISEIANKNI